MKFLKCILTGAASLVVGAVVIAFCAIIALRFMAGAKGQVPIVSHLATLAHSPVAWIVALVLFVVGFIGEYRRN